jgi:hypothetical protein
VKQSCRNVQHVVRSTVKRKWRSYAVTDELCSHCEHAKHYVTYRIKQAKRV